MRKGRLRRGHEQNWRINWHQVNRRERFYLYFEMLLEVCV